MIVPFLNGETVICHPLTESRPAVLSYAPSMIGSPGVLAAGYLILETMPGFDKRDVLAATPQAELMAGACPVRDNDLVAIGHHRIPDDPAAGELIGIRLHVVHPPAEPGDQRMLSVLWCAVHDATTFRLS
jgi:hypothetical protein